MEDDFLFGCTMIDEYERPFSCETTCLGEPCGNGCLCLFCEPQCERYRHFIAGILQCPVCKNDNYKIIGYKRIKCNMCKFVYCHNCYVQSDGDPEKCKVNPIPSFAFEHFYIEGKHVPNLRCKLFSKNFGRQENCVKCLKLFNTKNSYIKKLKTMKSIKKVKKEGKTVSVKEKSFSCPRSLENNSSDPKDLGIDTVDNVWRRNHKGCGNFTQNVCDCDRMDAKGGFEELRKKNNDCFKKFKFFCEFKEHMDNHDVNKGKTSLSLHVYSKNELLKDNDRLEFANELKEHFENNENVYSINSINGSDTFLKPPLDVVLILRKKAKIDNLKDIQNYPQSVGKVYGLGPKPLNDAKKEFLEEEIIQQKEYDRAVQETYNFADVKPLEWKVFRHRRKEEESIQFHDRCHKPKFQIDQEPVPNCSECDKTHEQGFVKFSRIKPQAVRSLRRSHHEEGLDKYPLWRYPRNVVDRTVFRCIENYSGSGIPPKYANYPCHFYSDHLCDLPLHQKEHYHGRKSTPFVLELEELPSVFSKRKNLTSDKESHNVAFDNVKTCQEFILEYLRANENILIAEVSFNHFVMRMDYSCRQNIFNGIVKNNVGFRVVTKDSFDHLRFMNEFIEASQHMKLPFYSIKKVNVRETYLLSDAWFNHKTKLYNYEEVPFEKVKPKLIKRKERHEEGIDDLKELLLSYELKEIKRLRRLIPHINFDLPPDFENEDSPQFWKGPCQWLKDRLINDYNWKPKFPSENTIHPEAQNHKDNEGSELSDENVEITLLKCFLPSDGFSYSREEWEKIEISQIEFYESLHKEAIFETSEDSSSLDVHDLKSESESSESRYYNDGDNNHLDDYDDYSE